MTRLSRLRRVWRPFRRAYDALVTLGAVRANPHRWLSGGGQDVGDEPFEERESVPDVLWIGQVVEP